MVFFLVGFLPEIWVFRGWQEMKIKNGFWLCFFLSKLPFELCWSFCLRNSHGMPSHWGIPVEILGPLSENLGDPCPKLSVDYPVGNKPGRQCSLEPAAQGAQGNQSDNTPSSYQRPQKPASAPRSSHRPTSATPGPPPCLKIDISGWKNRSRNPSRKTARVLWKRLTIADLAGMAHISPGPSHALCGGPFRKSASSRSYGF